MNHSHPDQAKGENAFGRSCATLRKRMHLTQRELGRLLELSEQAIQHWERGVYSPRLEHLKQLIELSLQRHAFTPGHEQEEAEHVWQAAQQRVDFASSWQQIQQAKQPAFSTPVLPSSRAPQESAVPGAPPTSSRFDWGEALDVRTFYGREQELALLTRWIVQEHCRVVSVLGMGGIGKSALAVSVMYRLASHFEVVIFRSLRDAPSCEVLLDDCLQVLSPRSLNIVPANLERRLSLLLEYLRQFRALVVLDNLEALLEEGEVKGRFRPGYEGYGRLLRRVGEATHRSCLLLTSREKPAEVELRRLEGKDAPVRALRLAGLSTAACEQLFAEKEVVGTPQDRAHLAEVYNGNPLALKIVAETIADHFGGEIGPFLAEGPVIFGSIAQLLNEQFVRLSPLEQMVLCWLAIGREPITFHELLAVLVASLPHGQVLEAIESLSRRSLIEHGHRPASFTLQTVVLEFVTAVLIERTTHEILQHQLQGLIQYGLEQAGAREYVRQTQVRLLVAPIIANLQSAYQGSVEVEELLLSLLDQLRERADYAQGYGPANLIALLRLQRGHLRGIDLSHLAIRGAYLQGVEMQDASLAGSMLRDTVLTEALDATWAVAISSTGQYWAAGSWRGEVRVWREAGQRLHLVWQAHTDNTFTLAFSPDERTLATGSWDGTVKLWDLQSGALLWTSWHTDFVYSVIFAPDGHTLASGGNDALIQLWDVPSGKHVQTLASQGGAVYSLAWSPDGFLLASGCCDGRIQLWQVQESQPAMSAKTLVGHTNWVHALAFAPDGTQLASGSWDSTVKLWDVASGRVRQTLTGHTERVYSVAWSPDGGTVASASFDKTIWLWDVAQNRYRAALHGHTGAVYHLAFTPESSRLLSGSEDSTIRVWDVTSGQCMRIMQGYAICMYDLDWSPDSMHLVSGSTDGLVIVWDVTGKTSPRVLGAHHWIVVGVAWSPDGRLLASSGWDNTIRLWEPATGDCLQILQDPDHEETLFHGVAWSPDGRLLASGSYLQGVYLWDVTAHRHRWVGRTNQPTCRRVDWSPDGTRLVGGGVDGHVYVWDAAEGTLLLRLVGHHGAVTSVAWSPDGRRLASGGSGELFVWDVQRGERARAFAGHPRVVSAIAWSPGRDLLISGDSDGVLRWWDVQSQECVRWQVAHQGTVQSLKVSPDGSRLASCGYDGAIRIWDLQSGEALRTLRHDRPYERLDITGIRGLTEAQKATLRALGAREDAPVNST